MSFKSLLITNEKSVNDYFFSFMLKKMKLFSKTFVVKLGSDFLNVMETKGQLHLSIPLPNGVSSLKQLNHQETDKYSNRVIDLIMMEIGDDIENYCCFFQNVENSFLIPIIIQRTQVRVISFCNEDILHKSTHISERDYLNSIKRLMEFSEKIIYTSPEVAKYLNKSYAVDKDKLKWWPYANFDLVVGEDRNFINIKNTFRVGAHDKVLTFYGDVMSEESIISLIDILKSLTKKTSQIRIFIVGSYELDFILKNLCDNAKIALTFMGTIEELELQKLFLISDCITYLGSRPITDSSFAFILENNRPLIAGNSKIPINNRNHPSFFPIKSKIIVSRLVVKGILQIISNNNFNYINPNEEVLLKKDPRTECLEQLLARRPEK